MKYCKDPFSLREHARVPENQIRVEHALPDRMVIDHDEMSGIDSYSYRSTSVDWSLAARLAGRYPKTVRNQGLQKDGNRQGDENS